MKSHYILDLRRHCLGMLTLSRVQWLCKSSNRTEEFLCQYKKWCVVAVSTCAGSTCRRRGTGRRRRCSGHAHTSLRRRRPLRCSCATWSVATRASTAAASTSATRRQPASDTTSQSSVSLLPVLSPYIPIPSWTYVLLMLSCMLTFVPSTRTLSLIKYLLANSK